MYFPILYPSAAEFWLSSCNNGFLTKKLETGWTSVQIPENFVFRADPSLCNWISRNFGMPLPLDVLALSSNQRRTNQCYKARLLDPELAHDGLLYIMTIQSYKEHDVMQENYILCIASPEMCFLQAARYLSTLELIKLGYDLCAIYCFDENREYQQTGRKPATDVEQILEYLKSCSGKRGVRNAEKALKYVLNSSNSPMETKLSMIAILPFFCGGYAVRRPELNKRVYLSRNATRMIGIDHLICDMVWEKEKVIVEYDSNLTHLEAKQHARDKARVSALSESGYTIICLTADSIRLQNIDNTFLSIRNALGMKKRTTEMERYRAKRREIISQILYNLS